MGAFPKVFRTRPGERASPVNLLTLGGLMSLAAIATATPDLAEQFRTLVNVTVLLSLYCYALVAMSLVRLSGGFTPARRVLAFATAGVTIACALAPPGAGTARSSLGATNLASALTAWARHGPRPGRWRLATTLPAPAVSTIATR